jgi:hypothetical protein
MLADIAEQKISDLASNFEYFNLYGLRGQVTIRKDSPNFSVRCVHTISLNCLIHQKEEIPRGIIIRWQEDFCAKRFRNFFL